MSTLVLLFHRQAQVAENGVLLFLVKRRVGVKFLQVLLESWYVADEHICPLLHIALRGSVDFTWLSEEELDA